MKPDYLLFAALPAVTALPGGLGFGFGWPGLAKRQSANVVTDQLLFSVSLGTFTSRRNARDPPYLNWDSDNCSYSPDNPFGFPFVPACQRHDFGYRNYKAQNRFTSANKLRIDDNFRNDMYFICSSQSSGGTCRATADVYYWAVRAFGRTDASAAKVGSVDTEALAAYNEAVATLNEMVAQIKARESLPN